MAGRRIDGLSLALAAAGSLLAYSGVKGYSLPHALQAFVAGKPPSGPPQYPVTAVAPGSAAVNGPIPGGGTFSSGQLQSLWILAGGNPARAAVAACIAGHESSGDAAAESPNPDGGINVGLWQLDTKGKGAGYTVAQLKDPLTNARAAVAGSGNGNDWSAWSTAPMCGV